MVWTLIGKWLFSCYAARRLSRAQKKLERIKINNYRRSKGLPPIYTGCEKICRWFDKIFSPCTNCFQKIFCPCCIDYSKKKGKRTFYEKLWINGTRQNHIVKTVVGFIVGILMSFLLWNAVHSEMPDAFSGSTGFRSLFQRQRETSTSVKIFLICIGVLLTGALTLSEASRCVCALAVMQFFTNKGRAAVLAYTLILALSGPAKNTTTNMEILTSSLACGQELLKNSVLDLFNFVKEPFTSFQKAISHIVESLDHVFGKLKTELAVIVDAIKDIVSVIRSVYRTLKTVVDICDTEFGTPYDRCMDSFNSVTDNCKRRLGDGWDLVCTPVHVFKHLCHVTKVSDAIICFFPSLVREHVFDPIVKHFKNFASEFRKFFDARLNITYKLDHHFTRDKTFTQVFEGMKNDILSRCEWIFEYISLMDITLLLPFVYVFYKGLSYRWRFLHVDRSDNYYLSNSLIQLDIRRMGVGGQSIFPLRHRELNLYVETFSWRMIKEERKQRKFGIVLVCLASVQILSYVFIDYALYKFMEWIRLNAAVEYKKWNNPLLGLTATVEGEGFLAAMYRSIIENLNPLNFVLPSLDTRKCLPEAVKPNYRTYFWISLLLLLCLFLAMFEPYGLRLRHLICGWVYPYRVRERERWLHMHILSTRGSFLEFAKKTIRDKLGFRRRKNWRNTKGRIRKKGFAVSCTDRLIHNCPILANIFDPTMIKCFICGTRGHEDDRENFIDCLECSTVYCKECMADMNDQCVICSKAMDSGVSSGSDAEDEPEVYRDSDDESEDAEPLLRKYNESKMGNKKFKR